MALDESDIGSIIHVPARHCQAAEGPRSMTPSGVTDLEERRENEVITVPFG